MSSTLPLSELPALKRSAHVWVGLPDRLRDPIGGKGLTLPVRFNLIKLRLDPRDSAGTVAGPRAARYAARAALMRTGEV